MNKVVSRCELPLYRYRVVNWFTSQNHPIASRGEVKPHCKINVGLYQPSSD